MRHSTNATNKNMLDTLTLEMKTIFKNDERRINHALTVLKYATMIEEKLKKTSFSHSINHEVIVAAALLHDIGIKAAEKRYNSSAGYYQEKEGPSIAESILKKCEVFPQDKITEVLSIIKNHHSGNIDTIEFKIIWDADRIVNIPDLYKNQTAKYLTTKINKNCKTVVGKQIASSIYCKEA